MLFQPVRQPSKRILSLNVIVLGPSSQELQYPSTLLYTNNSFGSCSQLAALQRSG